MPKNSNIAINCSQYFEMSWITQKCKLFYNITKGVVQDKVISPTTSLLKNKFPWIGESVSNIKTQAQNKWEKISTWTSTKWQNSESCKKIGKFLRNLKDDYAKPLMQKMSEKVLSYIEQFEQTANGEKVVKGFRWVLQTKLIQYLKEHGPKFLWSSLKIIIGLIFIMLQKLIPLLSKCFQSFKKTQFYRDMITRNLSLEKVNIQVKISPHKEQVQVIAIGSLKQPERVVESFKKIQNTAQVRTIIKKRQKDIPKLKSSELELSYLKKYNKDSENSTITPQQLGLEIIHTLPTYKKSLNYLLQNNQVQIKDIYFQHGYKQNKNSSIFGEIKITNLTRQSVEFELSEGQLFGCDPKYNMQHVTVKSFSGMIPALETKLFEIYGFCADQSRSWPSRAEDSFNLTSYRLKMFNNQLSQSEVWNITEAVH